MPRVLRADRAIAWFLASGLTLGLAPESASAQTPSLDLRQYRPSTDARAFLYLEPVSTPGPGEWNVGAWVSYAHRSIVIENAAGEELAVPVRNQLSLDYTAGIGVGTRFAFGLSLPTVLYQEGDDPPPPTGGVELPTTGLGDLALTAKAALLPPGPLGGFGVAVLGEFTAPTGDRTSYVSEAGPNGGVRLLGELGLVAATLRASLGARFRSDPETFAQETFGHDLPWALGLTIRPQAFGWDESGRFLWTLESRGAVALSDGFASGASSPASLGLGARYALGDVGLVLGVEGPLNAAAGVPAVRAIAGLTWAPRFVDSDDDGFEDEDDDCPELAEDRDGFEDHDGCPDFDNDGDGVGDGDDKCQGKLEDSDGFQDEDGCPDLDNDGDGIADDKDACLNEAGPASSETGRNGCPFKDRDQDGIADGDDKCPTRAEDPDGFQDEDGCPDRDNDKDRIRDATDACPNEPGPSRSDPLLHGCPSPDADGDTYEGEADHCPGEAEDFDGDRDDDGCPDAAAGGAAERPLAAFQKRGERTVLELAAPITFETVELGVAPSAKSRPVLRALAALLNQNPEHVLLVAVRPENATAKAAQKALSASFAIVNELRSLTHRDEVAESIGWAALRKVPGAQRGNVGFLVLAPQKAAPGPSPAPRPQQPLAPPSGKAP